MKAISNQEFRKSLYDQIENLEHDGMVWDPTYNFGVTVEVCKEMIDITVDLFNEESINIIALDEDLSKDAIEKMKEEDLIIISDTLDKNLEVCKKATKIFLEKGFINQEIFDHAMENLKQIEEGVA